VPAPNASTSQSNPSSSGLPESIQLLNRSCVVTVGSVQISNIGQQLGLDVWFQVKRSLKPKSPNTCDLRLMNLSDATRKAIEQSAQPLPPPGGGPPTAKVPAKGGQGNLQDNTGTPVTIVAGYVGNASLIFQGALRSAQTVTDGATTTTELQTGDGDNAAILARTTFNFGAGTNAYQVALQLLKDMGCGVGNIASVQNVLKGAPAYGAGVTLKGSSYDILTDLARSCGLEVTLQKGIPQWLLLGQPLSGQSYLLQTVPVNTGVIGEPTVDTTGVLSIECLMAPGIIPGSTVVVKTSYINGLYRVTSLETTGDTAGADWKHSIEGKYVGLAP
jgi:hypothetical protein